MAEQARDIQPDPEKPSRKSSEKGRQLKKRPQSQDWSKLEAGGSFNLVDLGPNVEELISSVLPADEAAIKVFNITADSTATNDPVQKPKGQKSRRGFTAASLAGRFQLLLFLATGTAVTLVAQAVSDMDVFDRSVQVLALTKFGSTIAAARLLRAEGNKRTDMSQQCKVHLLLMGLLDFVGYASFASGLALCGAALSSTLSAATNQLMTALLSWAVLSRQLSRGQLLSLALISAGLMLRLWGSPQEASKESGNAGSEAFGVLLTVASAVCFSILNILYEHILRNERPSPNPQEVTLAVAWVGLICNLAYFIILCLPNWSSLLKLPSEQSTTHMKTAALIFLFALVYNFHSFVQGKVMQAEGALGVGLINVVRGSTVTIVSGSFLCSSARLQACFPISSVGSAAVVTAGGILWTFCQQRPQPLSESAAKLARAASGRLRKSFSVSRG